MGLLPTAQTLQRLVAPVSGSLSRILESFVKKRFWSKWDFQRQYVLALPVAFPGDIDYLVLLFLSIVNNSAYNMRKSALDILATLIPEAKSHRQSSSLNWHGADLIAPLLRLLTTPEVEEALNVLDIINTIHPDNMDKDILRMTLGSRQQFKEYENTKTLFGIPDAFGWSVPLPLESLQLTQTNVHSVFYLSVNAHANLSSASLAADSFNFNMDAYGGGIVNLDAVPTGMAGNLSFNHSTTSNDMQFQNDEFIPHTQNDVNSHDTAFESMDKILTDLDEFDNFFTRVAQPNRQLGLDSVREDADLFTDKLMPSTSGGNLRSNRSATTHIRSRTVSDAESIPQLYDKKVSLILNRSLARSPSQVSFHTTFADTFRPNANSGHNQIILARNNSVKSVQSRSSSIDSVNFASGFGSTTSINTSNLDTADVGMHNPLDRKFKDPDETIVPAVRKISNASDVSPKHKLDSESRKNRDSQERAQSESSFRLESLLKGRRRGKETKDKKGIEPKFQFPPR